MPYEDESKEKDEESHTYNVLYKGNGADGGEVPVDSNDYPEDQIVTVAFAGTMSSTG